jgi:hypothetical protein
MTPLRLLVPAAALLLAATPAWAEVCTDRSGGQYANSKVCVSSVLKPQGANKYGPENLAGQAEAAWCEGAPGSGKGEYVRFIFSETVTFRTVLIGNGYGKSKTAFFNNARARTIRIEAGGVTFAAELKDNDALQEIRLPRTVKTKALRVEIVDVYGGDKHQDLCMHYVTPDFEGMDRENQ